MLISSEKIYRNEGNWDVFKNVPDSAKYILDIGCGNGDNARILNKKGRIIDGITLSEKEKENAQQYMSNIYIHNLENGLPSDLAYKYDVIICSHVIEHIAYPKNLLTDIKQRLASNGILIVALPNIMHYQSRSKLLMGDFNYRESGIWDYTHLRWYTFKTGKELLTNNGFNLIKSFVSGDIPMLSFTKVIPFYLRQFLYRNIFIKISKGFFGGQLIYIAKEC
jgi:SAM-dependent methyltransferase